jgi:hypothetical protein
MDTWRIPALADWETTRDALHTAAQVLGAFQKYAATKQPNALHLALPVVDGGFSAELGNGTRGLLNLDRGTIDVLRPDVETVSLPVAGTGASLRDALGAVLHVDAAALTIERDLTAPLHLDPAQSADYADVVALARQALIRLRASAFALHSPLVMWPHNFDFSYLEFARGAQGEEASERHVAFGFAPASRGFPRPYFYVYARPFDPAVLHTPLAAPARWVTEPWKGVVVDYDALADAPDGLHTALAALASARVAFG